MWKIIFFEDKISGAKYSSFVGYTLRPKSNKMFVKRIKRYSPSQHKFRYDRVVLYIEIMDDINKIVYVSIPNALKDVTSDDGKER